MSKMFRNAFAGLFIVIFILVFYPAKQAAGADLIDDLKSKIEERNKIIKDLEKEITQYQAQVEKTGAQAKTLKNSIAALELTRKKLSAEIRIIENQIGKATLSIRELDMQISDTADTIARELEAIASALVQTDQEESGSFVETFFNYPSLSGFLDRVESLRELNQGLKAELKNVRLLKQDLENKETEVQGKRRRLLSLATDLSDRKKIAEYNKSQTNKLLAQTKNQEANYRKVLQEKQALYDSFQRELLDYESQLKFAVDPTSLPPTVSGVLKWPLDGLIKITQYFGNTDFARTHPQAYSGQGHNGIDLKAAIGTPILAALSGKVVGTGDTDTVCPNASYGRWALIEHPNGLSTLYAHLSLIKVSMGQSLSSGDLVGYSGQSGYATGPHLHFTVYATQGVRVITRKSKVCQGSYTIPVASFNAYLNPLSYL